MFIFPFVLLTPWVPLTSRPKHTPTASGVTGLGISARGAYTPLQAGTEPRTWGECCATLWDTVYSFSLERTEYAPSPGHQ